MSDRGVVGSRYGERPWYEALPDGWSWAMLWSGYVRCVCGGIRVIEAQCSVCSGASPEPRPVVILEADGKEHRLEPELAGAEGRYEDWVYGRVAALLKQVEQCRNRFTHGHPEAIDDTLVEELVAG